MHPRVRHALSMALVTLLAAGCGSAADTTSARGPELRDITVGVVASESSAGLYIAANQGLFREAGLNVTLKTITGAAAVLPALLHGSVQVIGAQLTTFIQAQASGAAQFRILAPGGSLGPHVESIVVPPGSPVTSPAQLKGKTIAVNAIGGIDQILAEISLRAYGVGPGHAHYAAVPFQGMDKALAAHRVDAAYLAEPYLTEAEQQLGAQVILDPDAGAAQGVMISAYVATRSWAQRYPRTAAAFARAIDQADALIITRPAVFTRAMEDQLHLSPQVADVMAPGTFPTALAGTQVQAVSNLLATAGALKTPFPVKVMLP
jgi:NitT/TauT family transport system substrate-binding protein